MAKIIKFHSAEVKNIVRFSNLLEAGAVIRTVTVAEAVDDVQVGNTSQVRTGNLVQAINFELNFNIEGSITTVIDWYFVKDNGAFLSTSVGVTNPSSTGAVGDDQRRYRMLEGMEMPAGINNSSAVKRAGLLMIPKHLQRMGKADRILFVYFVTASGNVADVCGKFIYKSKKP